MRAKRHLLHVGLRKWNLMLIQDIPRLSSFGFIGGRVTSTGRHPHAPPGIDSVRSIFSKTRGCPDQRSAERRQRRCRKATDASGLGQNPPKPAIP